MAQEEDEVEVWSGTPSQVVNMGNFIIYGLLFWLVIPLFIILWKWLEVKNTKYVITSQRLKISTGILNKRTEDLELYRVKDYKVDRPFFLRMFSLGNIVLHTSDKSDSIVLIKAIPKSEELREKLRKHVEACRTKKRVREVDFDG